MGFPKSDLFTRRCGSFPIRRLDCERAMAPVSHVRDHACRFLVITIANQSGFAQMFLALLRFGAQDMTQTGFMTLDFAGSRFFEALGSAFMCFQFRHKNQVSGLSKTVPQSSEQFCKLFGLRANG
jgi:hypothetical protein